VLAGVILAHHTFGKDLTGEHWELAL
jgi:hypothetical protein